MHLVSVHKNDKNLLNCETKELLNLNLVYEVEKSQSCEQCGETFGNKKELKEHILFIHGFRPK